MIIKSSAIDRLLQQNPNLGERRFGLPEVGGRGDGEILCEYPSSVFSAGSETS